MASVGLALALGLAGGAGDDEPAAPTATDVQGLGGVAFSDLDVELKAGSIHVVRGGEGPAVLLIPGFPETWYAWREVMPSLAADHTVIAVDPPGIGGSSIPASDLDSRAVAAELAKLLRRLGFAKAAVVGHDVGAWRAFALARFRPRLVTRLALLGAGIPGFGLERRLDPASPGGVSLPHVLTFMEPGAAESLAGAEDDLVVDFLAPEDAREGTFDGGAASVYAAALSPPGRLDAALAPYRSLPDDLSLNRRAGPLPAGIPVLGLDGERAAGELNLRTVRKAAPSARTGLVPGAGHFFAEERPGFLAARLRRFLRARPERR